MALTNEQLNALDACPILKQIKPFLVSLDTKTAYKVTCTVVDDQSTPEPVEGAVVTLTDSTDDSKTYTGTTGSAGGCNITNVPAGTYVVTAVATGMEDYTASDDLTITDEDVTLEIEMTTSTG